MPAYGPGRDFAIIGRDSPHAHYLAPPLTCFRLSLRDLGIALAESLLATMPAYAADYPLGVVRRVVPMDLVEGESDAFFPAQAEKEALPRYGRALAWDRQSISADSRAG